MQEKNSLKNNLLGIVYLVGALALFLMGCYAIFKGTKTLFNLIF